MEQGGRDVSTMLMAYPHLKNRSIRENLLPGFVFLRSN